MNEEVNRLASWRRSGCASAAVMVRPGRAPSLPATGTPHGKWALVWSSETTRAGCADGGGGGHRGLGERIARDEFSRVENLERLAESGPAAQAAARREERGCGQPGERCNLAKRACWAPAALAAPNGGHAGHADVSPTCPVSTEGWTRRVHFVREGRGGGGAGAVAADAPRPQRRLRPQRGGASAAPRAEHGTLRV